MQHLMVVSGVISGAIIIYLILCWVDGEIWEVKDDDDGNSR